MSYDPNESSQQGSAPVELYTITIGATTYRYTSAEDDVSEGADTFTAINIKRDRLATGGRDAAQQDLVIELPSDNAIVKQYINAVPGVKAEVTIERTQRPDSFSESIILFEGRIASVAFEDQGRRAKVKVEPRINAVSRPVPRFNYQGLCNHVLYDARCGVADSSPSFRLASAEVTAELGNTITVTGASANGDGYYTGGFVESQGGVDHRLIIDQTGEVLTLHLPFAAPVLGQDVNVYAGCDHQIATCKSKFNNVVNFGGFAYVPTKNVFESGLD